MDSQLVEKIVHEVKSQGVFDEFRRDSMADVDTKPAYQNLRQRVEKSVKKFLSEQTWTTETNKNQLREKLRRHITESGYLDVGVERIVDQVVNPKIRSVFQPRIEEITYKYLGIPQPPKENKPPPPPLMHPLPPLPLNGPALKVETSNLLPNGLEQISPDSDRHTVKSENLSGQCDMDIDLDWDKEDDDEESPPFEPLIDKEASTSYENKTKNEVDKCTANLKKEVVVESQMNAEEKTFIQESNGNILKTVANNVNKQIMNSVEGQVLQDSLLSNISNESSQEMSDKNIMVDSRQDTAAEANISEEAQMPKFGDNSNETSFQNSNSDKLQLHFDINKDEIKFEGTGRKSIMSEDIEEKESGKTNVKDDKINQSKSVFTFDDCDIQKSKGDIHDNTTEIQCSFNAQQSIESYAENTSSIDYTDIKDKNIVKPKGDTLTTCTIMKYSNSLTSSPTPSPVRKSEYSSKQSSPSSSSSMYNKKHSKKHKRSNSKSHDRHRSKSSADERRKLKKHRRDYEGHGHRHSHRHHHRQRHGYKRDNGHQSKSSTLSKDLSSSSSHKHRSVHKDSKLEDYSKKGKIFDTEEKLSSSHSEQSLSRSSSKFRLNKVKDDHQEIKSKLQRHKSHDSNDDDDDDTPIGQSSSQQLRNSTANLQNENNGKSGSSSSTTAKTKPKSNSAAKEASSAHSVANPLGDMFNTNSQDVDVSSLKCNNNNNNNNIVLLNDILVDPETRYVNLNFNSAADKHVFITMVSNNNNISTNYNNEMVNIHEMNVDEEGGLYFKTNAKKDSFYEMFSEDLKYFEIIPKEKLEVRLNVIAKALELCEETLKYLGKATCDAEFQKLNDFCTKYRSNFIIMKSYDKSNKDVIPRKRFKSNNNMDNDCNDFVVDTTCIRTNAKISPVPSECSINSKENESFDKNTNGITRGPSSEKLPCHRSVQKLIQQQRYSNEDLYKPRPILSQRTRRRGMDTVI